MPVIRFFLDVVRSRFDARTIALSRIAVGVAASGQGLLTWRMLRQLYMPDVARARVFTWVPDLTADFIGPFIICWLLASACFAAGAFTTIAGILLAGALAYQLLLDVNVYSNHVYLLMLSTILLTAARSGTALSIDGYLRTRAQQRSAGLPPSREALRRTAVALAEAGQACHDGEVRPTVPYAFVFLLQFQLTIVYFFTAVQKTNATFLSGWVLQRSLFFGNPAEDPTLYRALAVLVIVTELFLPLALWAPRLRPWGFVVGVGLHASLPILIVSEWRDLVVFTIVTLGLYFTFLPRIPGRLIVVWDDYCSFCAGWIRALRALDWLQVLDLTGSSNKDELERLRLSPDEVDEEIKVVADGKVYGGYDGFLRIANALPLTVFVAPLLGLLPVRAAGRRVYRAVAARRKCTYVSSPVRINSAGRR